MQKSIIISGPPAIGKTTISKGLAKEFGLQSLSGGDVLKELAQDQGFQTKGDDWWDTPEGMTFLNQRKDNYEFDKKVDQKLVEIFQKGGVVITSYTLPWLVKGGIKIWLGGSKQNSAKRMQTRDNMDMENALSIVKTRFDENKSLYKKLYGFDFGDDLSVFDVVINTDGLDAQGVLSKAIAEVRKL
ncbi:MAG: cytidylate kinase [Nitrososphaeria archaeon]|nr:cytidylate kinase [Nitrososphaeria archaeon]NDB50610.1 cytidylate kinase [Nitrosopumilaceae archaeon]NDB45712.1 cytidylate kinase [Nitrososphaeria archaeon]NDB62373.1 cytidylate kinase [Nitrosopumilaceae archaeon]NDB91846.1 cytidylate kinase [Nitrososphaeria archaeon]